jgi:multidrug resistance efflux pump
VADLTPDLKERVGEITQRLFAAWLSMRAHLPVLEAERAVESIVRDLQDAQCLATDRLVSQAELDQLRKALADAEASLVHYTEWLNATLRERNEARRIAEAQRDANHRRWCAEAGYDVERTSKILLPWE